MQARRLRLLATIAALAAGTATAACGVGPGLTGNDTGGIIQWTPAAQVHAREIAAAHCARFDKYARITSDHPHYGDYIAFACSWKPAYRAWHHRRRAGVKALD